MKILKKLFGSNTKVASEKNSSEYNFKKAWLEAVEERFGKANEIKEMQSEGKPKIFIFYFHDLPEEGTLTAITCGLSSSNHPEWKYGKPELIISMDSTDPSWGLGIGYFASAFFDEKSFSYGDVFKVDDPISEESPMNACFIFAPSFLDQEQARFDLPDRTINLTGMYPIYDEEIKLYDQIGLKDFWHHDGFEMYNPCRNQIKKM